MLHWSPRSRLRYACRQRRVIEVATARAVVCRVSYKCNDLKTSDINRASGYIVNNPTLSPQATMWGLADAPQYPQPWSGCRPGSQELQVVITTNLPRQYIDKNHGAIFFIAKFLYFCNLRVRSTNSLQIDQKTITNALRYGRI